jgi:hypothetical protein
MPDFVMIGEEAPNLDNVERISFEYGWAMLYYVSGKTQEFRDAEYRALLDFIRGAAPDLMAHDIAPEADDAARDTDSAEEQADRKEIQEIRTVGMGG